MGQECGHEVIESILGSGGVGMNKEACVAYLVC